MKQLGYVLALALAACATSQSQSNAGTGESGAQSAPQTFFQDEHVPVGIAISHQGRVFLAFSRAIDETEPFSVAEVVDGKPQPFPAGFKQDVGAPGQDRLLSVQALTVDAKDRLWILDTGKVGQAPILPGAPQLVAIDLATGQVVKRVTFPKDVASEKAFLNDVRIDLSKGSAGFAFITDSSTDGPNAIVVVDLSSGQSKRRLNDHPSTKAENLVEKSEGRDLILASGPMKGQPWKVGADGIALEADGHHLDYAPTTGHTMHRVSTDLLADFDASDDKIAASIQDIDKGFGSDGLLEDAEGNVYVTDYENNAVHELGKDGKLTTVAKSDGLLWPDSMALDAKGNLYVTATQIERGLMFHVDDQRKKPFTIWKIQTGSHPLFLGPQPQARR